MSVALSRHHTLIMRMGAWLALGCLLLFFVVEWWVR